MHGSGSMDFDSSKICNFKLDIEYISIPLDGIQYLRYIPVQQSKRVVQAPNHYYPHVLWQRYQVWQPNVLHIWADFDPRMYFVVADPIVHSASQLADNGGKKQENENEFIKSVLRNCVTRYVGLELLLNFILCLHLTTTNPSNVTKNLIKINVINNNLINRRIKRMKLRIMNFRISLNSSWLSLMLPCNLYSVKISGQGYLTRIWIQIEICKFNGK